MVSPLGSPGSYSSSQVNLATPAAPSPRTGSPSNAPPSPTTTPTQRSDPPQMSPLQAGLLEKLKQPSGSSSQQAMAAASTMELQNNLRSIAIKGGNISEFKEKLNELMELDPQALNKPDVTGFTLLSTASVHNNKEAVHALLDVGAVVEAANKNTPIAPELAIQCLNREVLDLLTPRMKDRQEASDVPIAFEMLEQHYQANYKKSGPYFKQSYIQEFFHQLSSKAYLGTTVGKTARAEQVGSFVGNVKYLMKDVGIEFPAPKNTLLLQHCLESHANSVEVLLMLGANTEAKDVDRNMTALQLMCAEGTSSSRMASLLIKAGADIEAQNEKDGNTALHYAASNNVGIVKILIDNGATCEIKNQAGQTPLNYCWDQFKERGGESKAKTVKMLIAAGAQINSRGNFNKTPLHHAAAAGDIESIKVLLTNGADIHARDKDDNTLLHTLARNMLSASDAEAMVEMIAGKGVDINSKNSDEATPLHFAARPIHETNADDLGALIEKLVREGAVIDAKDKSGQTPAHYATTFIHSYEAAATAITKLIEKGANINLEDETGKTPLDHATDHPADAEKLTALLIDKGARLGSNTVGDALELAKANKEERNRRNDKYEWLRRIRG